METPNKKNNFELVTGSIQYGKVNGTFFFQYFELQRDISCIAGRVMKSGVWILLNTLPWYQHLKQNMKRNFKNSSIPEDLLFLSVRSGDLKRGNLGLSNIPNGINFASFIHWTAFKYICNSSQVTNYIQVNIPLKDEPAFRRALTTFSSIFTKSTMVQGGNKFASGRKRSPLERCMSE